MAQDLYERVCTIYEQWCNGESTTDCTLLVRTIDILTELESSTQDERYGDLAREITNCSYFDDDITGLLGEFLM